MCLASIAARLPALEDCPSLLQDLAPRWGLGAAEHRAARALASTAGEKPTTQRGNGRFAIDQDYRGGWRSARLRRRKEGSRQKAPSVSGYGRVGAQGQGPQRQGTRPRWDQVGAGDCT